MTQTAEYAAYIVERWLKDVGSMRARLVTLETRCEALRDGIAGADQSTGAIAHSSASDALSDRVAQLIRLETRRDSAKRECEPEIAYAARICKRDTGSRALYDHYVMERKWSDCARAAGYSYKHLKRLTARSCEWMADLAPSRYRADHRAL